jgi:rubrerythrin
MTGRARNPLLALELEPVTRSAFLVRAALATGAAYGAGAAGSFVTRALAQTATSDVDVLNFALTLEAVEAGFYGAALKQAKLTGALRTLATELGEHEQAHAAALSQAITQSGGSPAAAPAVSFSVGDPRAFLSVAQSLEETGVAAYNGAIPSLRSADFVLAAASIAQVEARHAAAIRLRGGQPPAPAAFDPAISQPQAQAALKPFLK